MTAEKGAGLALAVLLVAFLAPGQSSVRALVNETEHQGSGRPVSHCSD